MGVNLKAKMKALILICIFILSCSHNHEVKQNLKPDKLTEKQILALHSMNERENAFMEDCLNECYTTYCNSFRTCLIQMSEKLECVSSTNKTNHMLDTAVGTAIGHGASKLLFGK